MEDKKRHRDDSDELGESELEIYSPEVKRLREDLLDSLDDETEFGSTSHGDLDSFMKSFEEEITASPSAVAVGDSGDSRPDLDFLYEASDDELGLPPTASSSGEATTELTRVESDSSELGSNYSEAMRYNSFEFGLGGELTEYGGGDGDGEYAALDGLFDYSDIGFGSGDDGWRPETLPAQ